MHLLMRDKRGESPDKRLAHLKQSQVGTARVVDIVARENSIEQHVGRSDTQMFPAVKL